MAAISGQPAPKPGSVGSAVPGADAQAAADKFFAQSPAISIPPSAETQAADKFFGNGQDPALVNDDPNDHSIIDAGANALGAGISAVGRAFDYARGNAVTAAATGAGMVQNALQGKNPLDQKITSDEDVKNALKGNAPAAAEYLKRLGVSEGGSLPLPGIGRVTLRGAEGLALDVLSDPLIAISKLVKEVPYLGKLLNGTNEGAQILGEAAYKSALPKTAKFTGEVRDTAGKVLARNGAPISNAAIAAKIQDLSEIMGKSRQALYDKVNAVGPINLSADGAFKNSEAVLAKMNRNPDFKPLAEELSQMIESRKQMNGGMHAIDDVSQWKTDLYDALPDSAKGPNGQLKGYAKTFKSALAADFRNAIVNTGNKVEPGLGTGIDTLNDKWGSLLSATKPVDKAAAAGGAKLGHAIDAAVLAATGVKGYAAKKAFEMAISPTSRKIVGKALMAAGRDGLATPALIHATINGVSPQSYGPQSVSQPVPQDSAPEASTSPLTEDSEQ